MQSLMISVSGVRGIVGEGLTPDIVSRYATAFGSFCGGGKIVVGRDARISGPMFENAVFSGLMAAGCTVISLGISATPTIQLAVEKLGADGGIAITASHNPQEWNAVKFMNRRGIFLDVKEGLTVLEIAESKQSGCVDYTGIGSVTHRSDFDREHIEAILSSAMIDAEVIRKRNFKVAVDCINGAGSGILPGLLSELNCEVIKINCNTDGEFTRGPEPVPENIEELSQTVVETGADAGLACDPDADRLAVVDEKGIPLGEEYTLVLAIKQILARQRGPVATNVSTTAAIDDIARLYNVDVHRTKVGEVHVVNAMIEHDCIIGGEGNGGVILPGLHYGRDAMAGAAIILQHMAETGLTLSEISSGLPAYFITKRKITVAAKKLQDRFEEIEKRAEGAVIDKTDGLKLIFPDFWVHLRKSNTEPIVRVIVEAKSVEKADSVAERYIKTLNEL